MASCAWRRCSAPRRCCANAASTRRRCWPNSAWIPARSTTRTTASTTARAAVFVQRCAELTACPHFGLLLGQQTTLLSLGTLGELMQRSPTVLVGAAQPGPAHAPADPRRCAHARHRRRQRHAGLRGLPARRAGADDRPTTLCWPSNSTSCAICAAALVAQRSVVLLCQAQGHPSLPAVLQGAAALRCRQHRDRVQEDLAGPGTAGP